MAKKNTSFVCTECGNDSTRWAGQCSACKEWNTIKEIRLSKDNPAEKHAGYSGIIGELLTDVTHPMPRWGCPLWVPAYHSVKG
jgi:DNA repair protein RadA/Sms